MALKHGNRLQQKLMGVTVGAITFGVLGLGISAAMPLLGILVPKAIAQEAERPTGNEPTTFLGWCQQKDAFPPATQLTIDRLLDRAGTTNCIQAGQLLSIRTLLDLGITGISDLRPLSSLVGLRQLVLYGNEISDLAPLSSLENLTSLQLGYNQISDVSALSSLTNLTLLGLIENEISDISPLASLTNLRELRLTSNSITDVAPLGQLTQLQRLYLNNNQITDITSLRSLTQLDTLNLSGNQIRETSVLDQLTELDEVYLYNNPIRTNVCPTNPDIFCLPNN